MNKTIVTKPFHENGGVTEFVKNITPSFDDNCILFSRGKRKPKSLMNFSLPLLDIFRFIFFISKERPNKVFINSSLSIVGIVRDGFFVAFSKFLGKRTILFIHGFDERALKYKILVRLGYFRADKIFVLSHDFNVHLKKLGFKGSIIETFNPISEEMFFNAPKRKIKENNSLKILMISRIEESKGILIGLEVLKRLQDRDIELHIAGTGSLLQRSKSFVTENELNNVFFHGFVSGKKKIELLKNADILLFPTFHNEGLPINILESLAMGLFVISRPVAGIKDLSQYYSMNLVDSLDPEDYKEIILQILDRGLPIDNINSNQSKAFKDFSPSNIYKKVIKDS